MSKPNINDNKGWKFRWTPEEDQILIKHYQDKTINELLELLPNRNIKGIYARAHKLGLKYRIYDETYFNVIDTEEKAYWLGFIYADGYVTSGDRWGITLSSVDYNHLEKLNKALKSNVIIRTRTSKPKEYKGQTISSSNHSTLLFKNKRMYDSLIDKGVVPNKTYNLKFPDHSVLDEHLLPHFIRGFFDGDGSYVFCRKDRVRKDRGGKIYNRLVKEISLVCYDESFIKDMQKTIKQQCGAEFRLNYNPKGNLPTLRCSNAENMFLFLEYITKDATIYLDRKKEKINEILEYCRTLQ